MVVVCQEGEKTPIHLTGFYHQKKRLRAGGETKDSGFRRVTSVPACVLVARRLCRLFCSFFVSVPHLPGVYVVLRSLFRIGKQ